MLGEITKAVIPIAGLATRFLPLSKVVPKEFFPLAGKPLIQYAIEELKSAGVNQIIFVVNSQKKLVEDYFRRSPHLEKLLSERKQDVILEEMKDLDKLLEGVTVSFVLDPKALGDGYSLLQAKKLVGENPCFVLYPDDIVESSIPCVVQLAGVFKTSLKPVIALSEVSKERLSSYGVVGVEKIASRLWKIKKIVEKPQEESTPSNLAIIGRYVLVPETFEYLKKQLPNKRGEITLSEAFGEMVKDGKIVYGYEVDGVWWECGNKENWLRSNVYFSLNHPEFGKELKQFVKDQKLV